MKRGGKRVRSKKKRNSVVALAQKFSFRDAATTAGNQHWQSKANHSTVKELPLRTVGFDRSFIKDVFYSFVAMSWMKFMMVVTVMYWVLAAGFAVAFLYNMEECVHHGSTFSDAFYLSIHTLSTVGYGSLYPTCGYSQMIVCFETIASMVLTAILTGLVYSKFSVPNARVRFADKIVINPEVGELRVRICNLRANDVYQARVGATFIYRDIDDCGDPFYNLKDLTLVRDEAPMFRYIWVVRHKIEGGPLERLSKRKMKKVQGSIVLTFNGIDGTLHDTIFAQRKYSVDQVMFNHKYRSAVYNEAAGSEHVTVVDATRLDDTVPCDICLNPLAVSTPTISTPFHAVDDSSSSDESHESEIEAHTAYSSGQHLSGASLAVVVEDSQLDALLSPGSHEAVALTEANFEAMVLGSEEAWLVELYSKTCKACKAFRPTWRWSSRQLAGVMKIGEVEAANDKVIASIGVPGFPALAMFRKGRGKSYASAVVSVGIRSSEQLLERLHHELSIQPRAPHAIHFTSGRRSGSGKRGDSHKAEAEAEAEAGSSQPVAIADSPAAHSAAITSLSDASFEEQVMGDGSTWVIKLHLSTCKACKAFAPAFHDFAVRHRRSPVKVGSLEGLANPETAAKFNVAGYPVIAVLRGADKSVAHAEVHVGKRSAERALRRISQELSREDTVSPPPPPPPAAAPVATVKLQLPSREADAVCTAPLMPLPSGDDDDDDKVEGQGSGSSESSEEMKQQQPVAEPVFDVKSQEGLLEMCPLHSHHSRSSMPSHHQHPLIGFNLSNPLYAHVMVQVARPFEEAKLDNFSAVPAQDMFKDKLVVAFGLPGAYTGVCSEFHVPSYLEAYDELKALGVDTLVCITVNDPFVCYAWSLDLEARGKITFLADGLAELTKLLQMDNYMYGGGMGLRSKRYSMIVDRGVVKSVNLETSVDALECSDGESMVELVKAYVRKA